MKVKLATYDRHVTYKLSLKLRVEKLEQARQKKTPNNWSTKFL